MEYRTILLHNFLFCRHVVHERGGLLIAWRMRSDHFLLNAWFLNYEKLYLYDTQQDNFYNMTHYSEAWTMTSNIISMFQSLYDQL